MVVVIPGSQEAIGEDDVNRLKAEFLSRYGLAKDFHQTKPVIYDTESPRLTQNPSFFILYLTMQGLLLRWYLLVHVLNFDAGNPSGKIRDGILGKLRDKGTSS